MKLMSLLLVVVAVHLKTYGVLTTSNWRGRLQPAPLLLSAPLATLARGYSITFDDKQQVLTSAKNLKAGNSVTTQLAEGSFNAVVSGVSQV
jgi:exonuclease VII large subunit